MARINASLPIQGEIRFETYSKRQAIVPVASAEPFSFSPRHTKQSTPRKQARTEGGGGGGGALGARAPPHLRKSSAQKCPKEERKFRPDMSAKKNVRVPLRYHKIKTKKLRK